MDVEQQEAEQQEQQEAEQQEEQQEAEQQEEQQDEQQGDEQGGEGELSRGGKKELMRMREVFECGSSSRIEQETDSEQDLQIVDGAAP